jgi:hypothetical protein
MGRTWSLSELNVVIDKRLTGIATSLQTSKLIPVNISNAVPPEIDQVLTATSKTTATWKDAGGGVLLSTTMPASEIVGGSGSVGIGISAARDDHVHPMPQFGTVAGTFCEGDDIRLISGSGIQLSTTMPASEIVGGSGSVGTGSTAARDDHIHSLPPFGTVAGTFCEGDDIRLVQTALVPGSITLMPSASSVAPGTFYLPTDNSYRYVASGSSWLIDVPYSPMLLAPGDMSSWTYESGTPGYAQMIARGSQYSTMQCLLQNPTPDYVDFLPPTPNIVTGSNGEWQIVATFRYAGIGAANSVNLYQNIGIFLLDESDHRFKWGISLTDSFFACAHATGFTSHTRNYYSSLTSKEMSDLNPANYTYHVRVRHSGSIYLTEYSRDAIDWTISTNGGINVLRWGGTGDNLTPTRWGVGCEYIPAGLANWDILQLRQMPTY